MIYLRTHILKASSIFMLMLFLLGCATYNERITPYYKNVYTGHYKDAEKSLDGNSLIKKPRNRLLYLMEKGRISHLNKEYEASNRYFNEADRLLEQGLGSVSDAAVGVFVNSMSQTYKGEDFEKFMIHYYKALNYVYLNKTEDAIVEARRIALQSQQQNDKFNNKDNRYSNDAFSLTLQGMLYESANDINNAFIAYRNAAEVYLRNPDKTWYGITIPLALEQDVIRTARLNGFYTEADEFEKQFGISYEAPKHSAGGELIVFWENGLAPVKTQTDLFFSLIRQSNGDLFFTDAGGGILIPFNYSGDRGRVNTKAVESLHIAYPKYVAQQPYFTSGSVSSNGTEVSFVKTEDVNELAFKTLQQRALTEMGKILSRLAVKKIAEYSVREAATNNGKTNGWLEGLGYGLQLYNALSEKADTRNWQTLPAYIAYARVPLNKGENEVTISLKNAQGLAETKTINIKGTGGLQFYNYATLK